MWVHLNIAGQKPQGFLLRIMKAQRAQYMPNCPSPRVVMGHREELRKAQGEKQTNTSKSEVIGLEVRLALPHLASCHQHKQGPGYLIQRGALLIPNKNLQWEFF